MILLSRIAAFVRNAFRRRRVDDDLGDELRSYLELVTAEKMRSGVPRLQAQRAARAELGGVEQVKEEVRDIRTGATLDVLTRDVRIGLRSLVKTPSFTIAAVLALALGIGATTAILSVVNGVLLRPLAYAASERLVVLMHDGRNPVSPANFVDWRSQTRSFTDIAAAEYWTPNLTGNDEPEHLLALRMTAGLLPMLGVKPLAGRVFTEAEDAPGGNQVAVLSYGLWQRRFAGDRSAIGRTIFLDGRPFTIVGVMPSDFQFAPFWATKAELWAPLALGVRARNRGASSLRVFARLRPGVTIDQARADLGAVTERLEQQFPGSNRNVTVQSLQQKVVGDVQTPLVVLLVAVAFVLLISCANVAHMLLARATARQKEMAVRTALGATRRRLVTQLLVESALLAIAGGVGGLVFAAWGVRSLVAASPTVIPRVATVSIDGRVLLMTLVITAATAIAFGLAPALRAARVDLATTFRDGDRGASDGRRRHRLRSVLVSSEFALALMLLVGAGLMIRTFTALQRIDPGFDPRNVVTMTIAVAGTKEAEPALRAAFYEQAVERVRATPGVAAASFINHLPIAGDIWGLAFAVEGRPPAKPGEAPTATYRVVFPDYFKTMAIPIRRGRAIDDTDRLDAQPVVVINEYMAKKHWPNYDPIGKRLRFGDAWRTVVGISKNAVRDQWSAPPEEETYVPYLQARDYLTGTESHVAYLTLIARASCEGRPRCDPAALGAPIVAAIRSIDRNMPISEVQTMSSVVDNATAESRFYLVLLAAFATIAVALAAVGIYGVMSYSVSRRTNEIGIRIALGAEPGAVVRFIVGHGMTLAIGGAAVGVVGALLLTRLMSGLLYGVAPRDLMTFVVVTAVLCAVAFVASYLPARRAARIDPLTALRAE